MITNPLQHHSPPRNPLITISAESSNTICPTFINLLLPLLLLPPHLGLDPLHQPLDLLPRRLDCMLVPTLPLPLTLLLVLVLIPLAHHPPPTPLRLFLMRGLLGRHHTLGRTLYAGLDGAGGAGVIVKDALQVCDGGGDDGAGGGCLQEAGQIGVAGGWVVLMVAGLYCIGVRDVLLVE